MPRLAAFPKAWLDALCVDGTLTVAKWIEMASTIGVEGLEFYSGFLELKDEANWPVFRRMTADRGMSIPMFCCSPDFTHPDARFRAKQVELEKQWIDMAAALGAGFCRVLSGQRRLEVSREDGLRFAAEGIEACLPYAAQRGITLVIENHYKDGYWQHPEFAQKMEVFCALIDRVHAPNFGVNYDPSNTILAGEDPLELLARVKDRVKSMHASDRYLAHGTIEDLRKEEDVTGYAQRLRHGEIGKGMNDYDAIFRMLADAGFDGWISIEDGMDGIEQMQRSADFLREKMGRYWG